MLQFLEKVRAWSSTEREEAAETAANIIVTQFKHDLVEMGSVDKLSRLDGDIQDGSIVDMMTANDYVARVFRADLLPVKMSAKSVAAVPLIREHFGKVVSEQEGDGTPGAVLD